MLDDIKREFAIMKYLPPLLLIAIVVFLAQVGLQILDTFSDIVLIIVFAWLLSFMLEPLVSFCVKKLKIPVLFSTLIVYLLSGILITLAFYFLVPVMGQQIHVLSLALPGYLKSSPPFIRNSVATSLNSVTNYFYIIPSLAQFLIYLVTTLVLSFYLIIERETITKTIHRITPKDWIPHLEFFERVVSQTIASFIRVQVIFGVISGVMTFIVLTLFGINFAFITAVVAGFLTVIPVVGTVIALIPPFFVAVVQNPSKALFILAILLAGQQISYNVLGPKLIGKAFKIHPIIVLLSILIGLKVAGIWGSIFAIPLVSIATIVGKEILERNEGK